MLIKAKSFEIDKLVHLQYRTFQFKILNIIYLKSSRRQVMREFGNAVVLRSSYAESTHSALLLTQIYPHVHIHTCITHVQISSTYIVASPDQYNQYSSSGAVCYIVLPCQLLIIHESYVVFLTFLYKYIHEFCIRQSYLIHSKRSFKSH